MIYKEEQINKGISKNNYLKQRHKEFEIIIHKQNKKIVLTRKICFYLFLVLYTYMMCVNTVLGLKFTFAYMVLNALLSLSNAIYVRMLEDKKHKYG